MIMSTASNTAKPLDMVNLSDPFLSILAAPSMAFMIMIIKAAIQNGQDHCLYQMFLRRNLDTFVVMVWPV